MREPVVQASVDNGIGTITLNRPGALNALDRDLLSALREAVSAMEHDRATRCVVIRGGEHFMAGGDLKWFLQLIEQRSAAEKTALFQNLVHEVHAVIISLRRMPKPVIASISGAAAGFGLSLVTACDLAIAADDAYFTLAYSLIGVTPDGGSTFALARSMGLKQAMEVALLGERFDATTAQAMGLINRVVPRESLEAETMKLAARLAAVPQLCMGASRRC